ncbi:hypothetical protein WN51_14460 [Melipona quadrifasciata]|uniref:Uncharacterized protein n=1 Tax=Melipona quadrifasciata TaxID=166423 RepID=A0A0N0BFQ0_9HYME|nr:hypothetical protein WN51_14460 [Melipona quadrifasciata]
MSHQAPSTNYVIKITPILNSVSERVMWWTTIIVDTTSSRVKSNLEVSTVLFLETRYAILPAVSMATTMDGLQGRASRSKLRSIARDYIKTIRDILHHWHHQHLTRCSRLIYRTRIQTNQAVIAYDLSKYEHKKVQDIRFYLTFEVESNEKYPKSRIEKVKRVKLVERMRLNIKVNKKVEVTLNVVKKFAEWELRMTSNVITCEGIQHSGQQSKNDAICDKVLELFSTDRQEIEWDLAPPGMVDVSFSGA